MTPDKPSEQVEGGKTIKRVRIEQHCGRCGKTGHNSRTCQTKIVDAEDSDDLE